MITGESGGVALSEMGQTLLEREEALEWEAGLTGAARAYRVAFQP